MFQRRMWCTTFYGTFRVWNIPGDPSATQANTCLCPKHESSNLNSHWISSICHHNYNLINPWNESLVDDDGLWCLRHLLNCKLFESLTIIFPVSCLLFVCEISILCFLSNERRLLWRQVFCFASELDIYFQIIVTLSKYYGSSTACHTCCCIHFEDFECKIISRKVRRLYVDGWGSSSVILNESLHGFW